MIRTGPAARRPTAPIRRQTVPPTMTASKTTTADDENAPNEENNEWKYRGSAVGFIETGLLATEIGDQDVEIKMLPTDPGRVNFAVRVDTPEMHIGEVVGLSPDEAERLAHDLLVSAAGAREERDE